MAEGSGAVPAPTPAPSSSSLKGLREQMVAAAQALAEERRNQSGVSPVPVPSPVSIKPSTKPVIDGSILRSEERQRLARERREEREKQHAAKETQILEKEKKAKLQYEKQMEEKQRRLKEQKLKEQQRRAAVEEKRKQKIEEEKEHYEAVVHRTLERSQRLETRQKRWSWSGSGTDSDRKAEASTEAEANKRSTSAANLKQAGMVINKRLSSSAALLNSPSKGSTKRSSSLNRLNSKVPLNSEQPVPKGLPVEQKGETEKKRSSSLNRVSSKPQSSPELENVQKEEKAARRSQFSSLESHVISRLLAPTQASLARSKSAATLSADGKDPSASSSSISSPVHAPKVPVRSRSTDRLKAAASSAENVSLESPQKSAAAKPSSSSAGRRAPSPSLSAPRRSPSPANVGKRPPSPAAIRQKAHQSSPNVLRQRPPSPVTVSKPAPIQRPSLTPNVLNITKKKTDLESKPKEKAGDAAGQEHGGPSHTSEKDVAGAMSKTKEDASSKGVPGTTSAEEAARILAEKRRLAREQKEREDQERAQREEEERIKKEAAARRALEEQEAARKALQELEEEKRQAEDAQQRLAEKERAQRELEEQEKQAELQLQREEAEAKALEEAERQRQERERIMQRNMQERLERKKRIEEIMKRTRKQNEAKNENKTNEEDEDVDDEEEEEEEEDLGLEKQDQPEKEAFDKTCLEDGTEVGPGNASLEEKPKTRTDDIFVNGDQQEEVDQTNHDGNSFYFIPRIEASPPAQATVIENSENVCVNEAEHSVGFISNLNGKSAWDFEEIIDLSLHPKTARLDPESLAADKPTQNFRDPAAAVPMSPKLAFEEEGAMNSLTKPIETASEL